MNVESNVVFGMYSGLALLMDVYHPERSNGYGIVYINGCGWHTAMDYDAISLKDIPATEQYASPLVNAGYTVFAINHRAAPRFRYPAAVEDAQRAVRFVRVHAEHYAVRRDRLGAAGGSSGGYLVSLLGVLEGTGDVESADPVNRASAKVQCVVARAAPADLIAGMSDSTSILTSHFIGMPDQLVVGPPLTRGSIEHRTYRDASPLHHVTATAAPFLLIHGDADTTVPFRNSEMMLDALKRNDVPARLLPIPGAGHGPTFPGAIDPPDYLGAMVSWFDEHLRGQS